MSSPNGSSTGFSMGNTSSGECRPRLPSPYVTPEDYCKSTSTDTTTSYGDGTGTKRYVPTLEHENVEFSN